VDAEFALDESTGITLANLLKVLGVAATGGQAKVLVQSGAVRVNGEVETRRGRRLVAGDVVLAPGRTIRVVGR
jgi:ribosome-associated protein